MLTSATFNTTQVPKTSPNSAAKPAEKGPRPKKQKALKGSKIAGFRGEAPHSVLTTGSSPTEGGEVDVKAARLGKWELLRLAKSALTGLANPSGKSWKVTGCMFGMTDQFVSVLKSSQYGTTHYSGLMPCGSPWTCPVCAEKITEYRRAEVEAACAVNVATGGSQLMLTLTFPHARRDELEQLVKSFLSALVSLKKGGDWSRMRARLGIFGSIRALETTWGEANGFHPHVHELLFSDRILEEYEIDNLQAFIFEKWVKACEKAGLGAPSAERGVNLKQAFSPAEYIAKFGYETKWGTGRELTKAHMKQGDEQRYTAFDLLRAGKNDEFLEFAWAYYGRAQLFWSRGLKARFGIGETEDKEIVEGQDNHAEMIAQLHKSVWEKVRTHSKEVRGTILAVAKADGIVGVVNLLFAEGIPVEVFQGKARKLTLSSEAVETEVVDDLTRLADEEKRVEFGKQFIADLTEFWRGEIEGKFTKFESATDLSKALAEERIYRSVGWEDEKNCRRVAWEKQCEADDKLLLK